jgi:hypothetical protein
MAMLLFWFWITNQLTVTGIEMSIAFLISTQGLLQYSKLCDKYLGANHEK